MKKYEWTNPALKKQNQNYTYLMILFMSITLVCLYLIPGNIRIVNLMPLALAVFMWWKAIRTQQKDKEYKKALTAKKARSK